MVTTTDADSAGLPVQSLIGVGEKLAQKLAQMQIKTAQDLLFHLPLRYQDRTRVTPIGALRAGAPALVQGDIELTEVAYRARRSLLCRLSDGTGSLMLRFFHFSNAQQRSLQQGTRLRCHGEVRRGPAMLEMVHPEYTRIGDSPPPLESKLTPIYPTATGIHQTTLRKLTEQALNRLDEFASPADLLPPALVKSTGFGDLHGAIRFVHRPPAGTDLSTLQDGSHPAVRRLAFEELLAYRLALLGIRQQFQQVAAPVLKPDLAQSAALYAQFGFDLTGAQRRVIDEIARDLNSRVPMLRLVQGDVGAGKTAVAAAAAATAVANGYQVALMAPTEILAEQHFQNFKTWFDPMGICVGWLTGKLTGRARRESLRALAAGSSQIVVGTHALFQNDITFQALGLSIIDEQHRFGVDQRMALRDKGRAALGGNSESRPHQLTMSATPIPRTLAMTAYADLDCSVLDELPPGRTPVKTVAMTNSRRDEIISRVGAVIANGGQAYWVCTLIEESETLQCQTAEDTHRKLAEALPACRVALLHGRMKSDQKDAIMGDFKHRRVDLLVATTVIEVGVDVTNASLMIIENAERLGLSQLHQLRGRIGRGSAVGSCVLLYQTPLSENARERISILRETNDGFVIAERDLALRGAGEVLGTQQSGEAQFRIADLSRDGNLLDDIKIAADYLQSETPEVIPSLIKRWRGELPEYRNI